MIRINQFSAVPMTFDAIDAVIWQAKAERAADLRAAGIQIGAMLMSLKERMRPAQQHLPQPGMYA